MRTLGTALHEHASPDHRRMRERYRAGSSLGVHQLPAVTQPVPFPYYHTLTLMLSLNLLLIGYAMIEFETVRHRPNLASVASFPPALAIAPYI